MGAASHRLPASGEHDAAAAPRLRWLRQAQMRRGLVVFVVAMVFWLLFSALDGPAPGFRLKFQRPGPRGACFEEPPGLSWPSLALRWLAPKPAADRPIPPFQRGPWRTKVLAILTQSGEPDARWTSRKRSTLVSECSDVFSVQWGPHRDPLATIHCPQCRFSEAISLLYNHVRHNVSVDYQYFLYLDDDQELCSWDPEVTAAQALCRGLGFEPLLAGLARAQVFQSDRFPADSELWVSRPDRLRHVHPASRATDGGSHLFHRSLGDFFIPFWGVGSNGVWEGMDFAALQTQPAKTVIFPDIGYRNKRRFNPDTHSAEENALRLNNASSLVRKAYFDCLHGDLRDKFKAWARVYDDTPFFLRAHADPLDWGPLSHPFSATAFGRVFNTSCEPFLRRREQLARLDWQPNLRSE